MPRFAGAVLFLLVALPIPAQAEWLARCQGGSTAGCFGEACGATPEEARKGCLLVCPGGDTHSVGTSSCSVTRPTQTPSAKASPTTRPSTSAQ
jgi:hypothetical protein